MNQQTRHDPYHEALLLDGALQEWRERLTDRGHIGRVHSESRKAAARRHEAIADECEATLDALLTAGGK